MPPIPQYLRHIHLPRRLNIPYPHATTIQNELVSEFLNYKKDVSRKPGEQPISSPPMPPTPTVLSFTPLPVFTTGRRERSTLTVSQVRDLKAPRIAWKTDDIGRKKANIETALISECPRGGQITFHGPGQLVIYPILDIKAIQSDLWPNGLTVRDYVWVLEEATIRTLEHYGLKGMRTKDPGVWVDEKTKIAALGVHLRRNITSFGVALNIKTDLEWFDRIVPCGLAGTAMTSMSKEKLKTGLNEGTSDEDLEGENERVNMEELGADPSLQVLLQETATDNTQDRLFAGRVAEVWTKLFADCLWGNVYRQHVGDIQRRKYLEATVEETGKLILKVAKISRRSQEPEVNESPLQWEPTNLEFVEEEDLLRKLAKLPKRKQGVTVNLSSLRQDPPILEFLEEKMTPEDLEETTGHVQGKFTPLAFAEEKAILKYIEENTGHVEWNEITEEEPVGVPDPVQEAADSELKAESPDDFEVDAELPMTHIRYFKDEHPRRKPVNALVDEESPFRFVLQRDGARAEVKARRASLVEGERKKHLIRYHGVPMPAILDPSSSETV